MFLFTSTRQHSAAILRDCFLNAFLDTDNADFTDSVLVSIILHINNIVT